MKLIQNPFRPDRGDTAPRAFPLPEGIPFPFDDPAPVLALLGRCPAAGETPLCGLPDLADRCRIAALWVKDERGRMGLGSFKALGAAHVIACDAAAARADAPEGALAGRTYVTASAGNHGLSVAAGAAVFGARAVVYLSDTVPDSFGRRLTARGAEVVRAGRTYEASMDAAAHAAAANGWTLLSDSSWEGYTEIPQRLMQGYLALMAEVAEQVTEIPTHVFVQAGVGGLAAAVAAFVRRTWGNAPLVVVVEPDAAPCIAKSLEKEAFTPVTGPVSDMGRLDCKEASMIALRGLARDADMVAILSDPEVGGTLQTLAEAGLSTTASGGASLAAVLRSGPHRAALGLDSSSRVLAFVTEEA